jgi:hypothetical protein
MNTMAITPTEAHHQAQTPARDLRKLEERIDKALVESMRDEYRTATFASELFPDATARRQIMDTYRHKEWHVHYTSNQRDGDYVTIGVAA